MDAAGIWKVFGSIAKCLVSLSIVESFVFGDYFNQLAIALAKILVLEKGNISAPDTFTII